MLARGFDHVSDDDFARVTIAQTFVHAPRLDPSGTSWLPFPFWALGAAMAAFGRSLAVARVTSIALASLAATLPYLALRGVGGPPLAPRGRAMLAIAFALVSPWSLWLGASTVPESFAASATAAAAIALTRDQISLRARVGFALALVAACLSRYEPWPVAAVLAGVLAVRGVRARDRAALGVAALAALGPVAWMAWNAHAHGSALHFFYRVASYKRALGEGAADPVAALLFYPRLFVATRPDVLAAAACALPLLRRPDLRSRWSVPLACVAAQLAFLAYGNARDGAPAHHAERALLGPSFLLACFAVDALAEALPDLRVRARGAVLTLVTMLGVGWVASAWGVLGEMPGTGPGEDRAAQIAEGLRLRGAEGLVVTPCAFEHFALLAAYGAPERAEVRPRSGEPVTPACPRVEVR